MLSSTQLSKLRDFSNEMHACCPKDENGKILEATIMALVQKNILHQTGTAVRDVIDGVKDRLDVLQKDQSDKIKMAIQNFFHSYSAPKRRLPRWVVFLWNSVFGRKRESGSEVPGTVIPVKSVAIAVSSHKNIELLLKNFLKQMSTMEKEQREAIVDEMILVCQNPKHTCSTQAKQFFLQTYHIEKTLVAKLVTVAAFAVTLRNAVLVPVQNQRAMYQEKRLLKSLVTILKNFDVKTGQTVIDVCKVFFAKGEEAQRVFFLENKEIMNPLYKKFKKGFYN